MKIRLKRSATSGLVGSVGVSAATQEVRETAPYYIRPRVNLDYRTGGLSIYGSASYNIDKQSLESEATTKYLEGTERETTKDSRSVSKPRYISARIGAMWEMVDNHSVGVDFDAYRVKNTLVRTSVGTTTVGGVASELVNRYDLGSLSSNRNLSFNYKWRIDERGSNFMVLGDWLHASRDRTEHNFSEEIGAASRVDDLRAQIVSMSDTYTLRADFTKILGKVTLEAGAKANYMKLAMRSENEAWVDDV